jgi:hypothetical protein
MRLTLTINVALAIQSSRHSIQYGFLAQASVRKHAQSTSHSSHSFRGFQCPRGLLYHCCWTWFSFNHNEKWYQNQLLGHLISACRRGFPYDSICRQISKRANERHWSSKCSITIHQTTLSKSLPFPLFRTSVPDTSSLGWWRRVTRNINIRKRCWNIYWVYSVMIDLRNVGFVGGTGTEPYSVFSLTWITGDLKLSTTPSWTEGTFG